MKPRVIRRAARKGKRKSDLKRSCVSRQHLNPQTARRRMLAKDLR